MRIFLAFMLLAFVLATPALADSQRTRTITTEQMAGKIMSDWGKVRVVFIYRATCPACHIMFDEYLEWITPYQDEISVLAFSTDRTAEELDRYLGDREMPFERLQVEPWQPGDFDRALKPTGIDIGKTFGTPLLAVIDSNNRLVGQYEGANGVKHARKWLAAALRAR